MDRDYLPIVKQWVINFIDTMDSSIKEGIARSGEDFGDIPKGIKIIFPIHPRTQQKIKLFNIHNFNQLHIVDPCNYFDFLALQKYAKIIFTDSGGIQEEACILKTPCVTIRKNTERPETIRIKSNILTNYNLTKIDYALNRMMKSKNKWNNPYGVNVSKKILQILTKEFKLK